ncbi:MAG: hypothetical protein ACI4M3_00845 [Acutalibacteraceae bacterium]
MKKLKKCLFAAIVASAVMMLSAGITQALLTGSAQKVNHINLSGDAVSAVLLEPEWNGIIDYVTIDGSEYAVYEYRNNVPVFGYKGGDYYSPVYDHDNSDAGTRAFADANGTPRVYGTDNAKNMIPGSSAKKNPYIVNTSEDMPVWAAARVTFVYAGANGKNTAKKGMPLDMSDMLTVYDMIEIDYNCDSVSSAWERIDDTPDDAYGVAASDITQTFYYTTRLDPDEQTVPLFTTVKVKESVSSEEIAYLKNMGGFVVYVEAFAMQGNQLTDYSDFKAWGIDGGVCFQNTPSKQHPISLEDV